MRFFSVIAAWACVLVLTAASGCASGPVGPIVRVPPPADDDVLAAAHDQKMAVLAGGCFWGIEAVFEHTRGVVLATTGYAGGSDGTATYDQVSTGNTGHAESVQIIYDPSVITYGGLLRIFFSVAHDPTQLNRQGPDEGTQYRSEIFTANPEQERIARAYIAQLDDASVFGAPIATRVAPLDSVDGFYPAEDYHQDYAARHPYDAYIVINDAPKVAALKKAWPGEYK